MAHKLRNFYFHLWPVKVITKDTDEQPGEEVQGWGRVGTPAPPPGGPPSQHLHAFANLDIPQTPSVRVFMEPSLDKLIKLLIIGEYCLLVIKVPTL